MSKMPSARAVILVVAVASLVVLPFALLGESFAERFLDGSQRGVVGLIAVAVGLLTADAVLPIPSSWVMMYVAQELGPFIAGVTGTLGLSLGVLVTGLIGKYGVGPVASQVLSDAEISRLRRSTEARLVLTLACLRSVPVMAEVSVLIAAAGKVPIRRIFIVTLLPNAVVSCVFSISGAASFSAAIIAFLSTVAVSYGMWRLSMRGKSE